MARRRKKRHEKKVAKRATPAASPATTTTARRRKKAATATKKKASSSPSSERTTTQIQVYLPPDLLEWLDADVRERQEEIQAEMGPTRGLSRSAHVVSILHNYRLAREAAREAARENGASPQNHREFWEAAQTAATKRSRR